MKFVIDNYTAFEWSLVVLFALGMCILFIKRRPIHLFMALIPILIYSFLLPAAELSYGRKAASTTRVHFHGKDIPVISFDEKSKILLVYDNGKPVMLQIVNVIKNQ